MIQQALNSMLVLMLAKFVLNDIPHAFITYGQERYIEGMVDLEREKRKESESLESGYKALVKLINDSPKKDDILVYLFYMSLRGGSRGELVLTQISPDEARALTAEKFGITIGEARKRIIVGGGYISSVWRPAGKYRRVYGPVARITALNMDRLLAEFGVA